MQSLRLVFLALTASLLLLAHPAAAARLTVTVDISEQQMTVRQDNRVTHRWPVSTARPGYRTPVGTYTPYRLERQWYSTIYDNAPMPYSIFFLRGYAIHGTTDTSHLGQPVSHGCVRLLTENAKTLFGYVKEVGMNETQIVIQP